MPRRGEAHRVLTRREEAASRQHSDNVRRPVVDLILAPLSRRCPGLHAPQEAFFPLQFSARRFLDRFLQRISRGRVGLKGRQRSDKTFEGGRARRAGASWEAARWDPCCRRFHKGFGGGEFRRGKAIRVDAARRARFGHRRPATLPVSACMPTRSSTWTSRDRANQLGAAAGWAATILPAGTVGPAWSATKAHGHDRSRLIGSS